MLFLRTCSVPPNSPPHNYEMLTASQQPRTEHSFIHRHITLSLNFMTILPTKQNIGSVMAVPSFINNHNNYNNHNRTRNVKK